MSDQILTKQPDLITVEPQRNTPCYFLGLSVEGVRSFAGQQNLDLSDGQGRAAQWTILLGDNGTGKTTLLQALAAFLPKQLKVQQDDKQQRTIFLPEIFLDHSRDEKIANFRRIGAQKFQLIAQLGIGAKLEDKGAYSQRPAVPVEINIDLSKGGSAGVFPEQVNLFQIYAYGAGRRLDRKSVGQGKSVDIG